MNLISKEVIQDGGYSYIHLPFHHLMKKKMIPI